MHTVNLATFFHDKQDKCPQGLWENAVASSGVQGPRLLLHSLHFKDL